VTAPDDVPTVRPASGTYHRLIETSTPNYPSAVDVKELVAQLRGIAEVMRAKHCDVDPLVMLEAVISQLEGEK
jgi:hypothetical protein